MDAKQTTLDAALTGLRNYRRLSDRLITSGQPNPEQLAAIAEAGFKTVINLRPDAEEGALPDERGAVQALGMAYEPIPVIWQRPQRADLDAFFAAMDRHAGGPVYVHCAANMRVSAFVFLYRTLRLDWPLADALPDLQALWQPNDTWQAFMDEMLAAKK